MNRLFPLFCLLFAQFVATTFAYCAPANQSLIPPFDISFAQTTETVTGSFASFRLQYKTERTYQRPPNAKALPEQPAVRAQCYAPDDSTVFELKRYQPDANRANLSVKAGNSRINRTIIRLHFPPSTDFYGGGEQFSHFLLNGQSFTMLSEEQGIGRGDQPLTLLTKIRGASGTDASTYYPIPFVITSQKTSLYIENCNRCRLNFDEDGTLTIENVGNSLQIAWRQAADYKELISHFSDINGKARTLPDWAYGNIIGLQGGSKKVTQTVENCLQNGLPIAGVWIQDWVGRRETALGSRLWWSWEADSSAYPAFSSFVAEMNRRQIRVLGYVNPYLATGTSMYAKALEKGYLVKDKAGKVLEIEVGGFSAAMVDLSCSTAFEWLKNIIKTNLLDAGMSGWMADFGEWLPFEAALCDGKNGGDYHNQYVVEWSRLNREAVEEWDSVRYATNPKHQRGEIVFFTRSGFAQTQRYTTLQWLGDQSVTWGENDGIKSAVTALNSGAMSGILLNHSDVGGYTSGKKAGIKMLRDRELLYRWAELSLFTPFFRTHEGLTPDLNFQCYDDTAAIHFFAHIAQLRQKLIPYLQKSVAEAVEKGLPVNRPLLMEFPDDKAVRDLKYQFMLGNNIVVAPVLEKGANTVSCYLPAGRWKHFITGKIYDGNQYHTLDAPFGTPAAFVQQKP